MRVKRQRQTRRHLRFLRTSFGFRPPFKLLCDGNFIHHATSLKLTALQESLPRLLGAAARVHTTPCVVKELRSLGEKFKESTFQARKLIPFRCGHEPAVSAAECLGSLVPAGNPLHFLVATQDPALQRQLLGLPGGAVVRAKGTALSLVPPSEAQLDLARERQGQAQAVPQHEREALRSGGRASAGDAQGGGSRVMKGASGLWETAEADKGEGNGLVSGEGALEQGVARVDWRKGYGGAGGEDEAEEEGKRKRRRPAVVKDVAQFKRKRPKGPNPLSCKKKVAKKEQPLSGQGGSPSEDSKGHKPTNRRRRRGKD